MTKDEKPRDPLPGNHGQFGVDKATEEFKPLEDHPPGMPHPEQTPIPDSKPA